MAVTTKLIEGKFPNVDQLIPQDGRSVVVPRAELLAAILRLRRIGNVVSVCFSRHLVTLKARSEKGDDEGTEMLEIVCAEELTVKLNMDYLADALRAISDDEVRLQFTDGLSPFLIRSSQVDWMALVMPMRSDDAAAKTTVEASTEPSAPAEPKAEEPTAPAPAAGSDKPAPAKDPDIAEMQKENARKAGLLPAEETAPAEPTEPATPTGEAAEDDFTALVDRAQAAIADDTLIGCSALQRRLGLRADVCIRVLEALEGRGIVGPPITGAKNLGKREVRVQPKA